MAVPRHSDGRSDLPLTLMLQRQVVAGHVV